jgi:hypothetical protein
MDTKQKIWNELLDYARCAPSPHNTQPCRLKIISQAQAELYFVRERGLRTGDPKGRFTFLTFGIFVEILRIAASHKGYTLHYEYTKAPLYQTEEEQQFIAKLSLIEGAEPDSLELDLIKKRRTSRLPYDNTEVAPEVIAELQAEASLFNNNIHTRRDNDSIRYVIELNRDSLFYDLEHEEYRKELREWLRYTHEEALKKKDGLAAETMHISGKLLHSFMFHHRIYTAPFIKQIVQRIYMSTMKGISTVAWIQGPYKNQDDWIRTGHLMIRLWLIITKHGLYWQPYGSIITNDEARVSMINKFNIKDERDGENMVWLLLRMGHSAPPPEAERLSFEELLL